MAKRYYQGSKDRMDERKGMSRKSMEGAMISSDYSAIANMPQNVKYVSYPGYNEGYMDGHINDTMRGIDKQVSSDDRGMKKQFKPEKY